MEVRASERTTLEAERGGRPTSHEFETSMDSMMISETELQSKSLHQNNNNSFRCS